MRTTKDVRALVPRSFKRRNCLITSLFRNQSIKTDGNDILGSCKSACLSDLLTAVTNISYNCTISNAKQRGLSRVRTQSQLISSAIEIWLPIIFQTESHLRGDSVTIGEGGPSPARVAAVTQNEYGCPEIKLPTG